MSKAYETIKVERKHGVLGIILNRAHRLNAFNIMLEELGDVLDTAEKDPSVKCVVITGDGDRALSAGADVTSAVRGWLTPRIWTHGLSVFNRRFERRRRSVYVETQG